MWASPSQRTAVSVPFFSFLSVSEFGYYQWAKNDSVQPFSSRITLDFYVQQCADIFKGAPANFTPDTRFVNDYFGGNQIVTSNTVFVNGDVDPWHVLGNYQTYDPASLSDTILVQGTAHCADMYPASANDLPGLLEARARQEVLLQKWLYLAEEPVQEQPKQQLAQSSRHMVDDQNVTVLADGVTEFGALSRGDWKYYAFKLSGVHANLSINVSAEHGDPGTSSHIGAYAPLVCTLSVPVSC